MLYWIGRTGRGDQTGTALTLLEEPELRFSRDLLAITKANGHRLSDYIWLEKEVPNARKHWDAHNANREWSKTQRNARTPGTAPEPEPAEGARAASDQPHQREVGWVAMGRESLRCTLQHDTASAKAC